jgi:hypothetical protein
MQTKERIISDIKQGGGQPGGSSDNGARSLELEISELRNEKNALAEELTECRTLNDQLRDEIQVEPRKDF